MRGRVTIHSKNVLTEVANAEYDCIVQSAPVPLDFDRPRPFRRSRSNGRRTEPLGVVRHDRDTVECIAEVSGLVLMVRSDRQFALADDNLSRMMLFLKVSHRHPCPTSGIPLRTQFSSRIDKSCVPWTGLHHCPGRVVGLLLGNSNVHVGQHRAIDMQTPHGRHAIATGLLELFVLSTCRPAVYVELVLHC
jgi:hypothetical protein